MDSVTCPSADVAGSQQRKIIVSANMIVSESSLGKSAFHQQC